MHEHTLGLRDNTSAILWLYRTREIKKATSYDRPVNFVTRNLAMIVIESNHSLVSQDCPGDNNVVSDQFNTLFSRDRQALGEKW